jgi:DNA-binding transcriptional MerR regulator/limonene-1,2-epoxide hydrolase
MTIVESFAEAFNRRDIDGILACFTDDATYDDLFYGEAGGHEGLRALFGRMLGEGAEIEWTLDNVVASPAVEIAEWTFRLVVSDAVPRSAGRTVSLRGVSVFELRDSRCCAYREYFDRGVGYVQLGLEPAALHQVLSREGGPSVTVAESLLIGEFARRCRLPVSTVRYYADVGLLLPAEVDPHTGYRRYRSDQIDQAVLLSRLRAIGVSLAAMKEILAGGAVATEALVEERRRLQREVTVRQRALAEIDELLGERIGPAPRQPVLVDLEPESVAILTLRSDVSAVTEAVTRGIVRLRRQLRETSGVWEPPFGAIFPLDVDDEVDVTVFVRAAPVAGAARLPGGAAAQVVHEGSHESLPQTYAALLDWIGHSGHEPAGSVIEEYLSLGADSDRMKRRTRLVVPLAPERS